MSMLEKQRAAPPTVDDLTFAIAECLNTCSHAGEWLLDMKMGPEHAARSRATVDLKQALILRDKLVAFVAARRP